MIPPTSTEELLARAYQWAGREIGSIIREYADNSGNNANNVPESFLPNKGWVGQFIEILLGANAHSLPQADFPKLGIELKTIPVTDKGHPLESTYVSKVPFQPKLGQTWEESVVWEKLRRILWVPIIGERDTPIANRLVGTALLWEPNDAQVEILKQDWEEHMEKVSLGNLSQLKSTEGVYLQVRPKALDSHVLCEHIGETGEKSLTLPRGFYLRTRLTREIFQTAYGF